MPILEISSAHAPKDLAAFTKKMSALFAELIGKPESVIITLISGINRFDELIASLVLFGHFHQGGQLHFWRL